ncbi:hydroxysqualene dehydroxylase HpnE [bacterium]|nr:hydroxysqualene dehydroxylase HpnE [bacterium]
MSRLPVAIIGGGVAGISAAVKLAKSGEPIILFERSDKLGGRIRSFYDSDFGIELDLGVHIISGGYKDFLALLRDLGTADDLQWIEPLHLPLKESGRPAYHLRFKNLPGMLGPLAGFLSYKALNIRQRFLLTAQLTRLMMMRYVPALSAEMWLRRVGTTPAQMHYFWEPLILATLNASPGQVGLASLRQIIQLGLSTPHGFSLGIAQKPWQKIIGDAALDYLQRKGVDVRLKTGVEQIIIENENISGLVIGSERIEVSAAILAVAPWDWKGIFTPEDFENLFDKVWQIPPASAIHGIHFLFDTEPPEANRLMTGLLGTTTHWIFPRCLQGKRWLLSTVASASEQLLSMSEQEVILLTLKELHSVWPAFDHKPIQARCVRVRWATCPFEADLEKRRPAQKTRVSGLFIANDACATGFPATLEGAVRAGFRAVNVIYGRAE